MMNLKNSRRTMVILAAVACALLALSGATVISKPATASPAFLYVKPTATGSGSCGSWAHACTLQTALGMAVNGDEIWVAEGTHKPTDDTDRTATFQLVNGVALYGGFAGNETSRGERDWTLHETILSGDIGTVGVTTDNSYHVVTGSGTVGTAILDGFTITAGRASGPLPDSRGGGMYNDGGSPTVANVTFNNNFAFFGGGMCNFGGSNPTLTNVTFHGNVANSWGGGMNNFDNSNPTLTDVIFSSNSAYSGGAMDSDNSSPTLLNVALSENSATYGGGMYTDSGSLTLINVTFSGNYAEYYGGGMNNNGGSATLTNVTFSGNSAGLSGGGMYNGNSINPTLTNVTLSGNSANSGGGIYNTTQSSPTLTNCIMSGNTAPAGAQIYNDSGTPTISHSLVQGSGGSGGTWDTNLGNDGGSNIDADPLFIRDPNPGDGDWTTLDDNDYGDLHLQLTSPAIDAGDSSALPPDTFDLDGDGNTTETLPYDLDGDPRVVKGVVDMGAYEVPVSLTLNKTVVNDEGGSATADDFQAYLDGEPVPWGVAQPVISGTHTVSETLLPSYSPSDWGGACAPDGTISVSIDEDATCSITNDDMAVTYLIVIKDVINNDGGTAVASDFTMGVTGTNPSPASFPGAEAPGTTVSLDAGSYSVSETGPSGYTVTYSTDCSGSIAVGETKTCTVTNDDSWYMIFLPLVLKNYSP